MSKYKPLSDRLSSHREDAWGPTFAELEEVLGFPLPKTARTSSAWWSNEPDKPHKKAWLDHGWHVHSVDRPGGSVSFRRIVAKATTGTVDVMGRPVPKAALFAGVAAVGAGILAVAARLLTRKR